MTWWRRSRSGAPLLVLLAGLAPLSCAPRIEQAATPLADPLQPPEILVEQRVLDFPPSLGATRFVHGWWGWRDDAGVLRMVPYAQPARLEIATLASRPRTLRFTTVVHRLPEAGKVEVRAGGATIAELPLEPTEVTLPALPIGRAPIDFVWPPDSGVGIEKAELVEALPAGRVEIEDSRLAQSGYSAVDFVRRLTAGSRLVGRFEPPSPARAEQSFHLLVERPGEPEEEVFSWPRPWWQLWRGRRFEIPLSPRDGLVRIRLLARGSGEPGLWKNLAIAAPTLPPQPTAAPPAPPKLVLVYVMDALRADHVGHLGGGGDTPTLDRLAAEGVTFANHRSLAPNTLPSTKTLFTGRAVLESNRQRLSPDGPPLLAELFSGAGYRTALLSGNGYVSDFYGVTRGFEHLDKSVLYEFHPKTDYNDNAEWVHGAALEWLESLDPGAPTLLYLHVVHPHSPYDPPREYLPEGFDSIESTLEGDSETLLQVRQGELAAGPADRDRVRALYRAGLAYSDARLAELLAGILRRYRPEEVLVIATSDHGEELFDHGGLLHGVTLHGEQLRIPLVAWWPGTLAPRRVDAPTDTQDVYVTLRQLVADYQPLPLAGRSLWPLLRGDSKAAGDDRVRFAAAPGVPGGIYSAESAGRKLIWAPQTGSQWGMGEGPGRSREPEYVFDLAGDPGETANLAGEPSLETDWLRSHLLGWIDIARALQPGQEEVARDEALERNLRALGYVN